ncbi:MAG: hypothetical protein AAF577_10800 [Pseudomonadota bacterium]
MTDRILRKNVVILFEGRCGSSHLTKLFDQRGDTRFEGEYLAEIQDRGWAAQRDWSASWFTRRFDGESEEAPVVMSGYKTKYRSVADIDAFGTHLAEHDVRVIRLYRESIFRQIVSAERAAHLNREHGIFNIEAGGADKAVGRIRIEEKAFRHWLHIFNEQERRIDDFIARLPLPKISMSYEELTANKTAALGRICDFVGLSYQDVPDYYAKHTPDDIASVVENYDELVAMAGGLRRSVAYALS